MTTRTSVWFSGHVQGVGFRATVQEIASTFAVAGYVENTSDGKVLVVFESTKAEAAAFIASIEYRMKGHIGRTDKLESAPNGEFGDAKPGALTIKW